MKKIILTLVLATSFFVNAQEENQGPKHKLSLEQRNELQLKRMTLDLDLTPAQQKEMAQVIAEQNSKREAKQKEMKANQQNKKELSADEKFKLENERLDAQIAHKAKMKKILNEEQFKKWEAKHEKRRHAVAKKRGMHKKSKMQEPK